MFNCVLLRVPLILFISKATEQSNTAVTFSYINEARRQLGNGGNRLLKLKRNLVRGEPASPSTQRRKWNSSRDILVATRNLILLLLPIIISKMRTGNCGYQSTPKCSRRQNKGNELKASGLCFFPSDSSIGSINLMVNICALLLLCSRNNWFDVTKLHENVAGESECARVRVPTKLL